MSLKAQKGVSIMTRKEVRRRIVEAFGSVEEAFKSSMFDTATEGMCLSCGEFAAGVEPDAERYICEVCGERSVTGMMNVIFRL